MSMTNEFERLKLALTAHLEDGNSLTEISKQSGVTRQTMLNWIKGEVPETISKAQAVMEALCRLKK